MRRNNNGPVKKVIQAKGEREISPNQPVSLLPPCEKFNIHFTVLVQSVVPM